MTSGGLGYAVERSIACVPAGGRGAFGSRGEVAVFGEWIGFEVVREPLYDPAEAGGREPDASAAFGADWSASLRARAGGGARGVALARPRGL